MSLEMFFFLLNSHAAKIWQVYISTSCSYISSLCLVLNSTIMRRVGRSGDDDQIGTIVTDKQSSSVST